MTILDGKNVSAQVKERVKNEALNLKNQGIEPALAVILVGEDKASQTYVAAKEKACIACDIKSVMHRLPESTTQSELIALIDVLNLDDGIDGILVQLPLPKHIDTNKILETISPEKDVDGFAAINAGKLASGLDGFVPCTPLGIMEIFKAYDINLEGKNAVVIGRSNIVGKPMANLLLNAIGRADFVTADMVKDGAVVIDVGINRMDDGKLKGDVKFDEVAPKCSFITPVPGGVGPMTIAMLLSNTIKSAKNRAKKA